MRVLFIVLGFLACGVVAIGILTWTPDRSRAELSSKYLGESTRYLDAAGTSLRVRDTGPKSAPVLLLMHGFGSSLETWERWSQMLSENYRVVRFDFPGCGLSEPDRTGRYDDARTLTIVRSLMDELGIDRAVLVGNSMGGRIAWKLAAELPSRATKLVLISPDGFASPGFDYGKPPHIPPVLTLMKFFLPKLLLRKNLAAAYGQPSRLSDAQVDRYYDLLRAPGSREATLDRMRQTVLEDPVPLLRRVRAPTLLMWGRQDRMIPYANSADYLRALPHASLVSLPTLGHLPQEESPAESLAPLQRFLAE